MKNFFIKTLAVLNLSEGVIHLITAGVSFWGMYSVDVWDWRVATSPTADLALGVFSILTGIVLGRWGCCHNHCEEKDAAGVQKVS